MEFDMLVFVIVGAVILIVLVVSLLIALRLRRYTQAQDWPVAEATITKVDRRRDHRSRFYDDYDNYCDIVYRDHHGVEHQTLIVLPYDYVPVGGHIQIAYSPDKPDEVVFRRALFMDTPEYIALMESKGMVRVDGGFVRKSGGIDINFERNE